MSNGQDYINSLVSQGLRIDGRKFDEYRDIKIEYKISSKSAEGSARVKIGETEVVAGVKLDVGTPYPDQPDQGTIVVNVELLPLSSPDFESGPPDVGAIELSRVVDRVVRESKVLDFKKLCIKEKEKMWMVFIDIYPINDAGNLYDACALAALAALKDAVFIKYDEKEERAVYNERTNVKLPLSGMPTSCTVVKIGKTLIIDPTTEEEKAMDARLTVGIMEDGNVCAMQKGGEGSLTTEDVDHMVELAVKKSKELRSAL